VHIFKLKEPNVQKREAMITALTFLTKEELMARRESLESLVANLSRFAETSIELTALVLR
jgi:hypothetical protein